MEKATEYISLIIDEISFSKAPFDSECAVTVSITSEASGKAYASGKVSFERLPAIMKTELKLPGYRRGSACSLSITVRPRIPSRNQEKKVFKARVSFQPSSGGGPGFNINNELCFSVGCRLVSRVLWKL